MDLKRCLHGATLALPLTLAAGVCSVDVQGSTLAPPILGADPRWPKPLPNGWVTGDVGGTCVDSHDHVFIVTRGFQNNNLTSPENVGGANPDTGALGGAYRTRPSPPVIEFDQDGNVVNGWGNPSLVPAGQPFAGQNAVMPNGMHGCYVDYQDNVWIGGNADGVVQKYSHGGTLLMQIGTKFTCDDGLGGSIPCTGTGGGNVGRTGVSHTLLNLPANVVVDPDPDPITGQPGSIYIADGYGNHRVVVFDATGHYLRQFGSAGAGQDQFTTAGSGHPHCIAMNKDKLIFACDRGQNKINVYQRDGSFVRAIPIVPGTPGGNGSAWDIAFSRDPQQKFAFVSDGGNEVMWVLDHAAALAGDPHPIIGGYGRPGHAPGEFTFLHLMAIDSKNNIYVGETIGGRRIQKLVVKSLPVPVAR